MRTCELSTSYAESVKAQALDQTKLQEIYLETLKADASSICDGLENNDDSSVAALLDLSNEVVEGLDKFWYDKDDEE